MKYSLRLIVCHTFAMFPIMLIAADYSALEASDAWRQIPTAEIAKSEVHSFVNGKMRELYRSLKYMPNQINDLEREIKEIERSKSLSVELSTLEPYIKSAEDRLAGLQSQTDVSYASLLISERDNTSLNFSPNEIFAKLDSPIKLAHYEPPLFCGKTGSQIGSDCLMLSCCPLWFPLSCLGLPFYGAFWCYKNWQIDKDASSITPIIATEYLSPKIHEEMKRYVASDELSQKIQDATVLFHEQLKVYNSELLILEQRLKSIRE